MGALLVLGGLAFNRLGMIAENGASYAHWDAAGEALKELEFDNRAAFAWGWGDWLVYGEDHFPHHYAQAMDKAGRELSTLKNYATAARHTPKWMRGLPRLGHRHYLEATRVSDHQARYAMLVQASNEKWSAERVEFEAKKLVALAAGGTPPPPPPPKAATLQDKLFEAEVTNRALKTVALKQHAELGRLNGNIAEARQILTNVAFVLPDREAAQVSEAIKYLEPVEADLELIDLLGQAIDLYQAGRFADMVEVMDKLAGLRAKLLEGE